MKNIFKKAVGILLAGAVLFSSAVSSSTIASAETTSKNTYTIKKKSVPVYSEWQDVKNGSKTTLYFVNGSDVPYVDLETIRKDFIYYRSKKMKDELTVVKYKGDTARMVYDGSAVVEFDFAKDRITFDDYDYVMSFTENNLDVTTVDFTDDDGNPKYINRYEEFLRTGNKKTFDLGAYDIDLVRSGKDYLVPLQTYGDIFLQPVLNVCYNGKALFKTLSGTASFFDENGDLTSLGKKYYKADATGKLSESTVRYAYNELCFAMDEFYGNKKSHKITSFDEYFKQTGLYSYLTSTNSKKVDTGLCLLINYLNDVHSYYRSSSYASGKDYKNKLNKKYGFPSEHIKVSDAFYDCDSAVKKYYPNDRPAYEEIGDTAFITLSSLYTDYSKDYYKTRPDSKADDTIGVIGYSFSQILRSRTPIRQVVLDLTTCSGGTDDAAAYLLAAFLGQTNIHLSSTTTEAQEVISVQADTNFDGAYDRKDCLASYGFKLYCLVSDATFSNGNKVSSVLRNSGYVTLVGRKTGGGSYSVSSLQTAYGSCIDISFNSDDSIMINGTFYNIDAGVEPHVYINNINTLYNRKSLMEYLDGLL